MACFILRKGFFLINSFECFLQKLNLILINNIKQQIYLSTTSILLSISYKKKKQVYNRFPYIIIYNTNTDDGLVIMA